MSKSEAKIFQYLSEAHATEVGLVRDLQAQIAMTPRGRYRSALESHLKDTRSHAERLQRRMGDLRAGGFEPVQLIVETAQAALGQAVALAKTPLDLLRGSGGEEKVLKNAKDTCAGEALEIATYLALEQLALALDDDATAKLAASIRADEEKMLERVKREIPALAHAVARAEVAGIGSYDAGQTGAAEAVREAAAETKKAARRTAASARSTSRQARRVPGVTAVEGAVKGAVASAADLPIANYDSLTADEIVEKLRDQSQIDLAKIDAYERSHQSRATVLNRVRSLRQPVPFPGYDEMTAGQVVECLRDADDELTRKVRDYERAHSNRATVLRATQRELSPA